MTNLLSVLIGAVLGGLFSYFTARQQMKVQLLQAEKERDEARMLLRGQMIQTVLVPAMDKAGEILVGIHLERPLAAEELKQLTEEWRVAGSRLYVSLNPQMADSINGPVQGYLNDLARFSKREVSRAYMQKRRDKVRQRLSEINQSIYGFSF